MATRTVRRPARDQLDELRYQADAAAAVYRVHVNICAQCTRAGRAVDRRCDFGYQLAREETTARSKMRRLEDESRAASEPGTLW